MAQYHIAFATDNNYLPFTFVVMQSIIDHISKDYRDISNDSVVFHILTDTSVNAEDCRSKSKSFSVRNAKIIENQIEIHIIDINKFAAAKGWGLHNSKSIYFRLLIDQFLTPEIKTILYLDVDTLVLSDIRELFDSTNLSGHVVAAVRDAILANKDADATTEIPSKQNPANQLTIKWHNYFNSGMLLINLESWRQNNIGTKCLELIHEDLTYIDQDALNIAIKDPLILPSKWNMQTASILYAHKHSLLNKCITDKHKNHDKYKPYFKDESLAADIISSIHNPAIAHFTFFKPWQQYIFPEFKDAKLICNSDIYSLIERWTLSANKVEEFGDALKYYKFDQWSHVNFRLIQIDNNINHEIKARRKTRKQLIAIMIAMFIIQLAITLALT